MNTGFSLLEGDKGTPPPTRLYPLVVYHIIYTPVFSTYSNTVYVWTSHTHLYTNPTVPPLPPSKVQSKLHSHHHLRSASVSHPSLLWLRLHLRRLPALRPVPTPMRRLLLLAHWRISSRARMREVQPESINKQL